MKPRVAKSLKDIQSSKLSRCQAKDDTNGKVPVTVGYTQSILSAMDLSNMKASVMEIAAEVELFVSSTFES